MRAAAERARKRQRSRTETKSNGIRSPVETRARTRQQANVEPPVRLEVTGIHSQRINGTYVPTVVEDYPWAEGGLVFAKDNAPRPNDGDAEWTGMYLCEVTEQWVVCDLMNNSRTVYAKSVDFGKACAADVLEWMVHEGEGEAGWRRRQGFVMSRTKWSETEEKG